MLMISAEGCEVGSGALFRGCDRRHLSEVRGDPLAYPLGSLVHLSMLSSEVKLGFHS